MSRRFKGFTLLESLAAAALIAVGFTAAMSALGAIAKSEGRAREVELLNRLAADKYDEMVSTPQQTLASANGDFTDRNLPGYTWSLDVETSQVNNLDTVTVTVQKSPSTNSDPVGRVESMIYINPNVTSATTTTTGTGAAGGARG